MADTTTSRKVMVAGTITALIVAVGSTAYNVAKPTYYVGGQLVLNMPNDGGQVVGEFQGLIHPVTGEADAGVDAGLDAGLDAGVDAGLDAGLDAGVDAGVVDATTPSTSLARSWSTGAGTVTFGMPLAQNAHPTSAISSLIVVDEARKVAVPAVIEPLATWQDGSGSLKVARVTAVLPSSGTYALTTPVASGIAAPVMATSVDWIADWGTVANNVATLTIGGGYTFRIESVSLFASIQQGSNPALIGAPLNIWTPLKIYNTGAVREFRVANANALTLDLVVDTRIGADTDATGMSLRRLYRFYRNSGRVDVRLVLTNEVNPCGDGVLSCAAAAPNAKQVINANWVLNAQANGAATIRAEASVVASGTDIALEQVQRTQYSNASTYTLVADGVNKAGVAAQDALLTVPLTGGMNIKVLPKKFAQMEPVKLWAKPSGFGMNYISNHVWIGARQAYYTEFTLALDAASTLTNTPTVIPLNAANTGVFEVAPTGANPTDTVMTNLFTRTVAKQASLSLLGAMTYGLFPRTWGDPMYSDEVSCTAPIGANGGWDQAYWCATWTDYHNTTESAPLWALSSSSPTIAAARVKWLDQISTPGALRSLYTQLFNCAPNDSSFRCGQAPAGYGGFRGDFNSSHAYLGNLMLYYYLTGDPEVIRILKPGAANMRSYLCSARPTAACSTTTAQIDEWASLEGRVFAQWQRTFRFLGETVDSSFWADWKANEERSFYYSSIVGTNGLGVWADRARGKTSGSSEQNWMGFGYDMRNLFRYADDLRRAGDVAGAARVGKLGATLVKSVLISGPIGVTAKWPNTYAFSAPSGSAGTLTLTAQWTGSDPQLWDTGKGMMVRAICAAATYDTTLQSYCTEWRNYALSVFGSAVAPLGKEIGEYMTGLIGVTP